MQHLVKIQKLLPLALHQPGHRDTRPALHNPGNFILRHPVTEQGVVMSIVDLLLLLGQLLLGFGQTTVFQLGCLLQIIVALGGFNLAVQILNGLPQLLHLADGVFLIVPLCLHGIEAIPLLCQLLLQLGKICLAQLVLLFFQGGFLDFHLDNLAGHRIQLGGHGVHFGTNLGARLIHQVNGLVRQEPVGDIPVRQGSSGNDGTVGNLHAVEHLIPLLEATENGNGVFHRRLVDHDRLEPAGKGRVFFNIGAIFVQGGSADAVQLAPRQHGL